MNQDAQDKSLIYGNLGADVIYGNLAADFLYGGKTMILSTGARQVIA